MAEPSNAHETGSISGIARSINFILLLSVILAMAFCIILMQRNKKIVAEFSQLENIENSPDEIKEGDLVAGFHASDLEGMPTKLFFHENPGLTMLLVVSPSCSACDDEVMDWWPQLATDPRLESLRPSMVVLADAAELLAKFPDEFLVGRIFTSPPSGLRRAYRIKSIPSLLLVSPLGEVVWYAKGGIDEGVFQQLIKAAENSDSTPIQSPDAPHGDQDHAGHDHGD